MKYGAVRKFFRLSKLNYGQAMYDFMILFLIFLNGLIA